MVFWSRSLWILLTWDSLWFWTWISASFLRLGSSQLLSVQISSLSLSLFFWDPYSVNVSMYTWCFLRSFLNHSFKNSVCFFCAAWVISITLSSFLLLIQSCVLSNLLLLPPSVFFIWVMYSLCLFGSSLYFINSLLTFPLCSSILLPSSLNIFMIITLNFLLGRLLVSTSFSSSGILSYSFTWNWRRKWQPPPVFLPGKSHGWRSLLGYSPRGCQESDTTEWLHFAWNIDFVTSFCLILCFYVCVLGRLVFFSNLEVTFCRRHPLQHCPSSRHALGVPSM